MITKDGWKLITYPTIDVKRLYNLKKDPSEMTDLASNPEYAGKLKLLSTALARLSADMDDPGIGQKAVSDDSRKKKIRKKKTAK